MSMSLVSMPTISRSMVIQNQKYGPTPKTARKATAPIEAIPSKKMQASETRVDISCRTQLFITTVETKLQSITDPSIRPPHSTYEGKQKFNTKEILDAAAHEIYAELKTATTDITFTTRRPQIDALFALLQGYESLNHPITKKSEKGDLTKAERLAAKFKLPDGGYDRYFSDVSLFKLEDTGTAPHVQYAVATLNFIYDNMKKEDRKQFLELKNQFYSDVPHPPSHHSLSAFHLHKPLVQLRTLGESNSITTPRAEDPKFSDDGNDYLYTSIYPADFTSTDSDDDSMRIPDSIEKYRDFPIAPIPTALDPSYSFDSIYLGQVDNDFFDSEMTDNEEGLDPSDLLPSLLENLPPEIKRSIKRYVDLPHRLTGVKGLLQNRV